MSALDRRLRRLEGRIPPESDGQALAFTGALCGFLAATFERGEGETLADIAARCCGLPDAPAFREALTGGLSANAVTAAGERRYGPGWRERMLATMEPMLAACEAHGGRETILALARVLPVVPVAERLVGPDAGPAR